jgi:hypothetical protein
MPGEVVDTNVLHLATAETLGWQRPRVPVDDPAVLRRVHDWLTTFRKDEQRLLVMDLPEQTIFREYRNKLEDSHYGRRVVQAKIDQGAIYYVTLQYWKNGDELVAELPDEVVEFFHDVGDRKIVAAAWYGDAAIVNAADGDWDDAVVAEGLRRLGVRVKQLLDPEERAAISSRSAP